jgi:hypothetical protein
MKPTVIALVVSMIRLTASVGTSTETNDFEAILKRGPLAEMPAVAALIVRQARSKDRIALATNVVKAAARVNPVLTITVVGAVVRAAPETAAAVSETAAGERPALACDVTRAAVAIDDSSVRQIVTQVSRAVPDDWYNIAVTASLAAPSANIEILRAVALLRPELRQYLEQEILRCAPKAPSVCRCLDRAEAAAARDRTLSNRNEDHPTDSEPKRSSSARPSNPKPPHGGDSPPGGRNYARP